MKCTKGYCFTLDSGIFCWCLRKYNRSLNVVLAGATNQTIWIRKLMKDPGEQVDGLKLL